MNQLLFNDYHLSEALDARQQELADEVASLEENRLVSQSPRNLARHLAEKYHVRELELDESGIEIECQDAKIDVRNRPDRHVWDRSRPCYVAGTTIRYIVPFTGEQSLFKCRPSQHHYNPPRGVIQKDKFVITYDLPLEERPRAKSAFENDIRELKCYIDFANSDVRKFNSTLHDTAVSHLQARQQKILDDKKFASDLGYPVNRRSNTEVASPVESDLPVDLHRSSASGDLTEHEFAPAINDYESVLSVLSNMSFVMERSPQSFKELNEETLRDHFLVHLNGLYGGLATGETFNGKGKTDILLRVDGENALIAECKFWSGSKAFYGAIDQLLSYSSWRDTKTALLIFNRDRRMSTVLKAIPRAIEEHSCYVSTETYDSETGFRYIFCRPDDEAKKLTLTVLVFDVPA